MILTHDGMGMSHAVRSLALAYELTRAFQKSSVLLLTDLPIIGKLHLPPCVDYIHLPAVIQTDTEELQVRHLNIKAKRALRIRHKIIHGAVKAYKPHLLLIDRDPGLMPEESHKILTDVQKIRPRCRRIWCLPDSCGEPSFVASWWNKNKIYELLEHHVDELWIMGKRDLFDLPFHYRFSNRLRAKSFFMGYPDLVKSRKTSHTSVSSSFATEQAGPIILLTCGSGHHAFSLANVYLDMVQEMVPTTPVYSVIVTGLMIPKQARKKLKKKAKTLRNLQVHRFTKRMIGYMKSADVVIHTGGFNYFCETRSLSKRTLVVPEPLDSGEPGHRTNLLTSAGWASGILEKPWDAPQFASMLDKILHEKVGDPSSQPDTEIPLDGYRNILTRIRTIMSFRNAA